MVKKIGGSWFEFSHHNIKEGVYYTPIVRTFTEAQWRAKIQEMKELGMTYLTLLCTSLCYSNYAEAYFPTDIYAPPADFGCKNPVEVLLDEADKQNMKVFLSVGYYGDCYRAYDNMISPEVQARAFRAMEQLTALYSRHPSFFGWYLPDEVGINPDYPPEFLHYVNSYAAFAHSLDKTKKMFIAPYGTRKVVVNDNFIRSLESLDADFVAYQDEVGVRKSTVDETGRFFEALRKAHDKAGRSALWADVETFTFEGDTYRSPLIPATADRLYKQLAAVSDYVDEILVYSYLGMMNKPGTIAYCGHPDSVSYYTGYRSLLEQGKIE